MSVITGPFTAQIGGTTVFVESGTLDTRGEIGQRSTCKFTVMDSAQSVWQDGLHIEVYDNNSNKVFGGFLDQDIVTKPGYGPTLEHQLTCRDYHALADQRVAFRTYLNTTAGAVATDLWANFLKAEGVTIGGIATGATLPEVLITYEKISKAMDQLARQSGYWWEIDEQRRLWFQPYTGQPAPWVMDGTMADQTQHLTLTRGNQQYVNRQYVKGAYDHLALSTITLAGNGGIGVYTLPYEIGEMKSVVVNGVTQTLGTKGVDSGKQVYYAVGDAVLAFDASQPVYGAGDTIQVTYKGRYPVVALAQSGAQIATRRARQGFGTGYVEAVYTDSKLHTFAAAFGIASGQQAHYGQDMRLLTFQTQQTGLKQGQILTVMLPMFGSDMANISMLIRAVELVDNVDGHNVWFQVEAVGSPYDVTWQTFFQTLTNQGDGPTDPLQLGDSTTAQTVVQQETAAFGWESNALTVTTTAGTPLYPSTTLYPSTSLYPG